MSYYNKNKLCKWDEADRILQTEEGRKMATANYIYSGYTHDIRGAGEKFYILNQN